MKYTQPARVRFGVFELDLSSGELCTGDRKTLLQEQPLQVLRMLIERGGEIVTREEIKGMLWPNDTIVEFDHSINAALKNLRRALGDSADDPKYIETLARRGYRLMVSVEWMEQLSVVSGQLSEAALAVAAPTELQHAVLTGRTVSHYRVLDIIGGGGMGVIYRSEDLKLSRRVALKVLPEELGNDPQALERFSREARAASSLDHSNICHIYEFGEHEGRPFMVMQLLQGETLRDRLARNERALPLQDLLDIGIQVSDGLQAAHEKGIIHRDIKPANIFLTSKGVVKILDFGLAKLMEGGGKEQTPDGVIPSAERSEASRDPYNRDDLDGIGVPRLLGRPLSRTTSSLGMTQEENDALDGSAEAAPLHPVTPAEAPLTRTGIAIGTAGYMSPEQVRGEHLDARTDLFSLGLVLYEMATGRRAFSGETAAKVHDAILNSSPAPMRDLNPALPGKLVTTIDKALEKDRKLRYQHAVELRTDLQQLKRSTSSTSNTIDAVPRPAPFVFPRWRSKLALWIGGLVLVGTIVAAVFYWRHRLSLAGSSAPRLTHRQITFVGDAYMPAISPDGKSVAYVTGREGIEQKLILQDLSGGASLELLHGNYLWRPRWSPDGSELLLSVKTDQGKIDGAFVVSRLGGAPRRVGRGRYSCWLPDGSQIVSTYQNSNLGVWSLDRLTGAEQHIPAPRYQWLYDIDCSAKTGMLLLLTQTSSKYQIWTMKPDGTEQRKLIEGESGITFRSPQWSPTGDAIYYFREEGGITELVRRPASGQSTGPSVLVSGLETGAFFTDYFTLSADGSQLAYTRRQSYSNLWSVKLPAPGASAEAREKPLTSGTLSYDDPSISPDGLWVAFTIGSGAKRNVYKMTTGGGQPVPLTFFDAAQTSGPAWSPDGRQVAFICDQGGTSKVWVVNANGSAARPLDKTNTSDTYDTLAWSPSPEIVYPTPGQHNLRLLNIETQEERPLLANDSKGWLLEKPIFSSDGKKIAIAYNSGHGVLGAWVFTPDKFSEGRFYPGVWPLGWSSDGNFIYAYADLHGREVLQVPLSDSKKPKSVIAMPGDIKAGTVSRDGRKIIVSVGVEKSDVWLMKDFDPQTARAN